jgi:hypothetical protein
MSFKAPILVAGITLALSLTAAQAFAGCAKTAETAAGQNIADTVAQQIRDKAPAQRKRLIKVQDCEVFQGVLTANFTYNYIDDKGAYAVDGAARVVDGKVEISKLKRPATIVASIDTNYTE